MSVQPDSDLFGNHIVGFLMKQLICLGHFQGVCALFCEFLSNVKVTDYSTTELTSSAVHDLVVAMETEILAPLLARFIADKMVCMQHILMFILLKSFLVFILYFDMSDFHQEYFSKIYRFYFNFVNFGLHAEIFS